MANEKKKKTCFVIGPIGSSDSQTRIDADFLLDGIIKEVLENEPFNYDVKRADKDVSPGSINSAVINDIINADLAIADLSERNPNAFYELGIRHAFKKPVIHMIREGETIPFDNLDQRCISFSTASWEGILAARENLRRCVNYVSSSEYKPSNPVGMAQAIQHLSNEGDEKGVLIATLIEKVDALQKKLEHKASTNSLMSSQKERNHLTDSNVKNLYDYISENNNSNDINNNSKYSSPLLAAIASLGGNQKT